MSHPTTTTNRDWLPLVLLGVALAASAGCEEPIDFERKPGERGTFGEEVHEILLRDLERSPLRARPRADAFALRRDAFVAAVDATLPDARLGEVDAMMIRMMPLYDDGMIPDLVRKLAVVLDEAAADPELLAAFARLDARPDLVQQPDRDRFLAHLMRFEQMQALNALLADAVLAHDGATDAGTTESDAVIQLLLALSVTMRETTVTGDPERFAATLVDVLLTEDERFAPAQAFEPLLVVRVDGRGLPKVTPSDLGGVPHPFVDLDADGLADIDASERFVGSDGTPLAGAVPFGTDAGNGMVRDPSGLLVNPSAGGPAFEYVDLHRTALGFLLRESAPLIEADVPFDLLRAMRVALGPDVLHSDAYGSWEGFSRDNELVGLTHGLLVALDHDDVPTVLEGLGTLMREHPDDLAKVLRALDVASEIADRHETDFADDSTLFDDLLPLLRELVETPGLLEDVVRAMDDPVARRMAEPIAQLMRYENEFIQIEKNGPYDACFHTCRDAHVIGTVERFECIRACPNDEIFAGLVDRSLPESPSNVSLFQRIDALMWETVDWPYAVTIESLQVGDSDFSNTARALGAAMIFEDLAEAYLLTLLGELRLEDVINPDVASLGEPLGLGGETVVSIIGWISANVLGIELDPVPSTDQVTRFFNHYPVEGSGEGITMQMSASICRSGRPCIHAHADTLLAIEASGMADTLVPMVRVFHAHGKTDLLARMLAVVFTHYPSRGVIYADVDGNPIPMQRSNIRSLEPMLIEILEDGGLLEALADNAPILADLTAADGTGFLDALGRHLTWVLTPDAALALHDGRTSSTDPAGNPVAPLSPLYLALDPLRALVDRLEADPAAEAAWERATGAAADLMLETVDDGAGGARFARAGGPVLAAVAIDRFREVWLAEDAAGTRSQWLREGPADDVADVLSGRALHAAVELFAWLEADPARMALVREVSLHALEAAATGEAPELLALFAYGVLTGGLDERSAVATGRFLGAVLDPTRVWDVPGRPELGLVLHGVLMLDATLPLDPDGVMLDVMGNAMALHPDGGGSNAARIWEVLREVNRVEPGAQGPLAPADYAEMLRLTAEFLRDDARGMERLYDFIAYAMHGSGGAP